MKSELSVALYATGNQLWTGGLNYHKNLIEALHKYAPQIKISLLTQAAPKDISDNDRAYYSQIIHVPHGPFFMRVNDAIARRLGYDFALWRALHLKNSNIDVIFPANTLVGTRIASLSWIPDFQHIYLPEMYSAQHLKNRNFDIQQAIKHTTLVVLSSQDALKDFKKFSPTFTHKARVMNFVAHVPERVYAQSPKYIVEKYNLPDRFFYLPNQFWKHKNHLVVFEALKHLKEKNITPFIVCTGNLVDFRNPTYFAHLIQHLSMWNIRDQVAFLGLVPHEDVYSLVRQSICVINPSQFEGWSTTVEEAKSIGKPILLSDLAVHREQNPPLATYFQTHDVLDLANNLAEIWKVAPSGPNIELEKEARDKLPQRMQDYVNTFVSIASEAVKKVNY